MQLRQQFRRPDAYGLLLIMILASILVSAALAGRSIGKVATLVLLGGTLLFAMETSRVGSGLRRMARVLVPATVAAVGVSVMVGKGRGLDALESIVTMLLVLSAMTAIVSRLRTHPTISFKTVLGALSVYLLLGFLFAAAFAAIAAIAGQAFFVQKGAGHGIDYLYFSYVTLSTVGYGDLTAATDTGRMLAASEGLIGQLFLVTVVALFVTNLGKAPRRPVRDDK